MANQVWAYDFVFDACANGQQLKCLTVIDEFTRESLAIDVSGSIRSGRVIEVLSRLISERGEPAVLRSDNGPEFVSKALLRWAVTNRLETALIEPGKPWQNAEVERYNRTVWDEWLDLCIFGSITKGTRSRRIGDGHLTTNSPTSGVRPHECYRLAPLQLSTSP